MGNHFKPGDRIRPIQLLIDKEVEWVSRYLPYAVVKEITSSGNFIRVEKPDYKILSSKYFEHYMEEASEIDELFNIIEDRIKNIEDGKRQFQHR
jgi:hypothetical protein